MRLGSNGYGFEIKDGIARLYDWHMCCVKAERLDSTDLKYLEQEPDKAEDKIWDDMIHSYENRTNRVRIFESTLHVYERKGVEQYKVQVYYWFIDKKGNRTHSHMLRAFFMVKDVEGYLKWVRVNPDASVIPSSVIWARCAK